MTTSIVFTFIGTDKPGIVEKLAQIVTEQGANWLESRMSQLAGYFTGIARVQISEAKIQTLIAALNTLNSNDLTITIQANKPNQVNDDYQLKTLNLIGNDRSGIVKELASALAALNINVCKMNTHITSAAMTADTLFEAIIEIQIPAALKLDDLIDKLDLIENQLSLDITLDD